MPDRFVDGSSFSGRGLAIVFLTLPVSLIAGAFVGLAFGHWVDQELLFFPQEIQNILHNLAPPFLAGAIGGATPIVVLRFFSPDEPFWFISFLMAALLCFFVVITSMVFFSPLRLLSQALAMEGPGFLFGSLLATTFTKSGDRFDRTATRLVLIALVLLWISSGGTYLWSLAPLSPKQL